MLSLTRRSRHVQVIALRKSHTGVGVPGSRFRSCSVACFMDSVRPFVSGSS